MCHQVGLHQNRTVDATGIMVTHTYTYPRGGEPYGVTLRVTESGHAAETIRITPVDPDMLFTPAVYLYPLKQYFPTNALWYLHTPRAAWDKRDTGTFCSMANILPLNRGCSRDHSLGQRRVFSYR